jgi:hypothetical protein
MLGWSGLTTPHRGPAVSWGQEVTGDGRLWGEEARLVGALRERGAPAGAAVGLVEVHVAAGLARQLLEVVSVVAGFALIRLWLRGNRVALDLAQARRRR